MTDQGVRGLPEVASGPVEQPARRFDRGRWLRIGVALAVVVTVALRFLASSPLWLDEAQTVDIAHRSISGLFTALRHDGSPPLYYVLLHWWMQLFGTSNVAVRALSGVLSVAALPVTWLVARRLLPQ